MGRSAPQPCLREETVAGTEYGKIWSPFARSTEGADRGKLIMGQWFRPEFELLQYADWSWSEKINGTNVRVTWDGRRVRFGGRTDTALVPTPLLSKLQDLFTEEVMEQQFKGNPAVLFGEGCGANIQAGSGNYGKQPRFILFDALIDGWWLQPQSLEALSEQLDIEYAQVWRWGPVKEAIEVVSAGLQSAYGNFMAEGLVGKPPLGLLGRDGDRLLMKVKAKDFYTAPVK